MSYRGYHEPDPTVPEGMAFIMSAGFVDPRKGKTYQDREPICLIQSWDITSKLWWELGLRWHPELATKFLTGGGQFTVAQIVDQKPDERTFEQDAEEVLELFSEENPQFVEDIKRLRESGSPEERAAMLKNFERNIQALSKISEFIESK